MQLDDVDWTTGSLLIRSSKTHTERLLPLAQDVGEAVLAYLRTARPPSTTRDIFLEHTAPYSPLQTASAITKIVQRLLCKAGIVRRSAGAQRKVAQSNRSRSGRACHRATNRSRPRSGRDEAHELGPAAQTRLRHRYRTVPELRLCLEDHCRHRRSAGDCQNPHPPGPTYPRTAARAGAAIRFIPNGLRATTRLLT